MKTFLGASGNGASTGQQFQVSLAHSVCSPGFESPGFNLSPITRDIRTAPRPSPAPSSLSR
jgi:hypothetical protein